MARARAPPPNASVVVVELCISRSAGAKDGVAANNDHTDCAGDREPKKTGIDDILVDYFHDYFQDYFKIYGIVCRGASLIT